jgi:hypothetical protein
MGSLHFHNPFGHTVALGSDSVSNRNDYYDYLLGGKDGRGVADSRTTSIYRLS